MPTINTRIIVFAVIGAIILVLVLIFAGIIPGLKEDAVKTEGPTGKLTVWVLQDSQLAYDAAVKRFKSVYQNMDVSFRSFSDEKTYRAALLEGFSTNQGPDVFMVDNASVMRDANKIEPLPKQKLSLVQLQNFFPRVVERDFVSLDGRIFGLPLSIDTLVMIYNKDIFDAEGVAEVPKTWEEFNAIIPKLAKTEGGTRITRAAAAIGGSEKNIDHASDLLQLIMMQSGVSMTKTNPFSASFSPAGDDAMRFYLGFSDIKNSVYTWNSLMPSSLDSFAEGKTAVIFNYASSLEKIKNKNQWMNAGIAPVPYPAQAKCQNEYECRTAYARYYGYTVSKQSKLQTPAWDLVLFMTTQSDTAKDYMEKTNKSPALRFLIGQVANNPEFSVEAAQALIAKSWQQPDRDQVASLFSEAIELVLTGKKDSAQALQQTEDGVNQLIKEKGL